MRRSLLGSSMFLLGLVGSLTVGGSSASAQYPVGGVVYETVAPATSTVTYGEQARVRYKRHKTVVRERPVAYVSQTPAVVRETRYVQPAPVIESRIIQPAPLVESVIVQPEPVVQTRYISRYPY